MMNTAAVNSTKPMIRAGLVPTVRPALKPTPTPPVLPKPAPKVIPEPDHLLFDESRLHGKTLRFRLTSGREIEGIVVRYGKYSVQVKPQSSGDVVVLYKHVLEQVTAPEH